MSQSLVIVGTSIGRNSPDCNSTRLNVGNSGDAGHDLTGLTHALIAQRLGNSGKGKVFPFFFYKKVPKTHFYAE